MSPPCHQQSQNHPEDATVVAADPYLVDHLQFMHEQEETTYQIPAIADYLGPSHKHKAAVTRADRRTMAEWSYDTVRSCAISREIACVGIQYFDRFLCTSSPRAEDALASRREFQLAFIACLVLAVKCRAGLQVDAAFVSGTLCQKLYDEGEVIGMERDVLSALQWRLNGPSPHEFIAGMVALLPPGAARVVEGGADGAALAERLTTLARKQAEVAMLDYATALRQSPSSIAHAALMTAMQSIGSDAFRPLDRLTWMSDIDMVTGSKWTDCSVEPWPSSASEEEVVRCCRTVSSSATAPVSPIPSSMRPEEKSGGLRPYLDMLFVASSREFVTDNYSSPVSSMLNSFQ